jgi:hypothetical protein
MRAGCLNEKNALRVGRVRAARALLPLLPLLTVGALKT